MGGFSQEFIVVLMGFEDLLQKGWVVIWLNLRVFDMEVG